MKGCFYFALWALLKCGLHFRDTVIMEYFLISHSNIRLYWGQNKHRLKTTSILSSGAGCRPMFRDPVLHAHTIMMPLCSSLPFGAQCWIQYSPCTTITTPVVGLVGTGWTDRDPTMPPLGSPISKDVPSWVTHFSPGRLRRIVSVPGSIKGR